MADDLRLSERAWVPRGAPVASIAIGLNGPTGPIDADALPTVVLESVDENGATTTHLNTALVVDQDGVGAYVATMDTSVTNSPEGLYRATWAYSIGGEPQTAVTYIEIGPSSPDYVRLSTEMKEKVEDIMVAFADLYDSPLGGPHLSVYLQTNFGRNRIAQILTSSINEISAWANGIDFGLGPEIDGKRAFPIGRYGALIQSKSLMSIIEHLIRSYTEQPNVVGSSVTRFDRRDYMDRWMRVLELERRKHDDLLDRFRMDFMGLGSVNVFVAGGMYPRLLPYRTHRGYVAARGYFSYYHHI